MSTPPPLFSRRRVTFLLGNGFSRDVGFPSMEELWNLGLQCSIPWLEEALEDARSRYPLSFFIKKELKELELLLTVWKADWESRSRYLDENATDSGEGGYTAYITNLCNHLHLYTLKGLQHNNVATSTACFRRIRDVADISFITTNYDLLLEWMVSRGLGASFTFLETPDNTCLPIRKLHGSLGWQFLRDRIQNSPVIYKLKDNDEEPQRVTGYIHDVTDQFLKVFNLPLERADKEYEGTVLQLGDPNNYTIIPPTIGKRYSSLSQKVLQLAFQDLMQSNDLVIGGYSFPEADPIIQQLILSAVKERKPRVIVVNPSDTEIRGRLQALGPDISITYLPYGWSEALAKLVQVLESPSDGQFGKIGVVLNNAA